MAKKPDLHGSFEERELQKAQEQLEHFENQVKELTLDRMNEAPKLETEAQTKLSQNEIANSKDVYLKPKRTISSQEKFKEVFRSKYEYAKEYVYFIAENKEIIGESIDMWTKPFPGVPAEEWMVPVNTPVWGPRYLAEQIKKASYHRLIMKQDQSFGSDHMGQYQGVMVADNIVQRLDAMPATKKRSIFMGATSF